MSQLWPALLAAAVGGALSWPIAFRHGHRTGWYRGYAARKAERFDGENYR